MTLVFPDREGETLGVKYSENYRWKYLRGMTPEEVVLIKWCVVLLSDTLICSDCYFRYSVSTRSRMAASLYSHHIQLSTIQRPPKDLHCVNRLSFAPWSSTTRFTDYYWVNDSSTWYLCSLQFFRHVYVT